MARPATRHVSPFRRRADSGAQSAVPPSGAPTLPAAQGAEGNTLRVRRRTRVGQRRSSGRIEIGRRDDGAAEVRVASRTTLTQVPPEPFRSRWGSPRDASEGAAGCRGRNGRARRPRPPRSTRPVARAGEKALQAQSQVAYGRVFRSVCRGAAECSCAAAARLTSSRSYPAHPFVAFLVGYWIKW